MIAPGCMVDGNAMAPVLIIAMAPGREELQADRPLVGGSGKLLWKQLLKKAGINRADCYIVNTIGEWPEGVGGSPTQAQLHKWWDVFDEAVGRSTAKVALLLGGDAFHRFTGISGGIEDWRGYLVARDERHMLSRTVIHNGVYKTSNSKRGITKGDIKLEKRKEAISSPWPESVIWAIPSLHPAAILRTGYATLPVFAADCARLGRALRGELAITAQPWYDRPLFHAGGDGPCVFDIETGGIGDDSITRTGATTNGMVWTAPWSGFARGALSSTLGHGPSIAFNIAFDAPRLAASGVEVPEPWWDVMLAAALAKPDLKKSLNYVSSLYLDTQRWKHMAESDPAKYNALDVAKTAELYPVLKAELERTGQLELFEKRMMPSIPTLVRMTGRGIKVDRAVKDNWVAKLSAAQIDVLKEWSELAPGIKTAGKNLLSFLYNDMKLPVQYHKHGGITSEISGLKTLLMSEQLDDKQQRVLNTLLDLRGIQKELKTYAEIGISGDGCVHPGFLPAGKDTDSFGKGIAGTGRPTSSNPNIQNQPQSARLMYISHRNDMVLLEGDFSQIEARIIAQLADDDVLRAAINEGLHESNQRALGVDKTRAKNGFYGWAYGAGKRTLSRTFIGRGYKISERECGELLNGFNERFKSTAAWRERVAAEVSNRYYLSNVFGRRRYFMGGSRDVPKGLDYHPQSDAADIMWTVLRQLEDRLRGVDAFLLATVHDSILIEVRADLLDSAATIMREVMQQPWIELGGMYIPVDFKTGDNWGSMNAYAGRDSQEVRN